MSLAAHFDSNILIDFTKGSVLAKAELVAHERWFVSRISVIEILAGVTPGNEPETRRLLNLFVPLELTAEIAEHSATLRRSTRLKLPDAIIYATALEHGVTLITRNTRDFNEQMPGVRIPYTL